MNPLTREADGQSSRRGIIGSATMALAAAIASTRSEATAAPDSPGSPRFDRTASEIAAGVTPANPTFVPGDVRRYGADPSGQQDSTSAIQSALNANASVFIPDGIFRMSGLTIPVRGTVLHGTGVRSVLVHTGHGNAITCHDPSESVAPNGAPAYVHNGHYQLRDFTLYSNGPIGIDVSKTRASQTTIERLYMLPAAYFTSLTSSRFQRGMTAISCDNNPWAPTYSTYGITVRQCTIAGYQNAILLNEVVNFFEISACYVLDCLIFVTLAANPGRNPGVTGIRVLNSYHESGIPGSRGVVFGAGGGNQVAIQHTSFELTNSAGQQYAYDFTAGGNWQQITVTGCKYLLFGDGDAVNGRRIAGAAPLGFLEINRQYQNAAYGSLPMIWAPGVSGDHPLQLPAAVRTGGFQQGNGRVSLGRNDSDAGDCIISTDGGGNLNLSGVAGLNFQTGGNASPATRWQVQHGGAFAPAADGSYTIGTPASRVSTVYSATGAISTSDAREKQQIAELTAAERDTAAQLRRSIRSFKFNDSVAAKGAANARRHVGIIAQDVAGAFLSNGLDPRDYAVFCEDSWHELNGQRVEPDATGAFPPGSKEIRRLGIRYDELLAFMLGAV